MHDTHEQEAENPAHSEEGHVHEENEHIHTDACNHEHHDVHHDHQEADMTLSEPNKEITAVLLKFRNKMGIVTWPRIIAQNTKMQAASPAIEVNRIFSLFGVGLKALEYLAYAIMLISGISIFISLYNRLKERKYEFALMRINGASRMQLLFLLVTESLFLVIVGFLLEQFLVELP